MIKRAIIFFNGTKAAHGIAQNYNGRVDVRFRRITPHAKADGALCFRLCQANSSQDMRRFRDARCTGGSGRCSKLRLNK